MSPPAWRSHPLADSPHPRPGVRRTAPCDRSTLLLPEYQIDDPAPANVRGVGVAEVGEDVVAVAPGVLERVRG